MDAITSGRRTSTGVAVVGKFAAGRNGDEVGENILNWSDRFRPRLTQSKSHRSLLALSQSKLTWRVPVQCRVGWVLSSSLLCGRVADIQIQLGER